MDISYYYWLAFVGCTAGINSTTSQQYCTSSRYIGVGVGVGVTVLIDYEICSHEQLGLACGTNTCKC